MMLLLNPGAGKSERAIRARKPANIIKNVRNGAPSSPVQIKTHEISQGTTGFRCEPWKVFIANSLIKKVICKHCFFDIANTRRDDLGAASGCGVKKQGDKDQRTHPKLHSFVEKVSLHLRTDVSEQEPTGHSIAEPSDGGACDTRSIARGDHSSLAAVVARYWNCDCGDSKAGVVGAFAAEAAQRHHVELAALRRKVQQDAALGSFSVAKFSDNREAYHTGTTAADCERKAERGERDRKLSHKGLRGRLISLKLTLATASGNLSVQIGNRFAGICTPSTLRRPKAAPPMRGFFYGRADGATARWAAPQGGSANPVRPATRDLHPSGRVHSILRRCQS
ncbi:hypothetical protein RIdsm_03656 [Roseovarius indicus]|uniref:Uncharacterized protein n=1 Tax=Roseovarius indicus TaxID=540747 RepID=A0A5P3AGC8_9RHOB|nr:hypothetical protein RIdsm_03656 [Roseovarius indicus]SFE79531.1 hypothetical protein SAMN04488031_12230 [Roseovarius indicus]